MLMSLCFHSQGIEILCKVAHRPRRLITFHSQPLETTSDFAFVTDFVELLHTRISKPNVMTGHKMIEPMQEKMKAATIYHSVFPCVGN